MDTSLKQRLIGAAVIVALAVIFIPMLFDSTERKEPVTLDMDVPPKPKYTFENSRQAPPADAQAFNGDASAGRAGATGVVARSKLQRRAPAASKIAQSPVPKPLSERAKRRAQGVAPPKIRSQAVWPTEQVEPAPIANAAKAKVATAPAQIAPPDVKGPISGNSRSLPQGTIPSKLANAPAARKHAETPPAQSSAAADAVLSGWAVQVGSFSERDNAMVLLDKLRSSGFTAFQERSASGGEQVFRVKVGPATNRERAEALLARLRNQENLQGIVVSQSPDS